MAKELMEIGGFITSGAEIVNHDASLSGNGTVDSPLGTNVNKWVDITSAFDVRTSNLTTDSYMTFLYNEALGLVSWTFKFKALSGGLDNTACRICTIPEQYRPVAGFELSYLDKNYCDYNRLNNGMIIPRNSSGYFSNCMTWACSANVITQ